MSEANVPLLQVADFSAVCPDGHVVVGDVDLTVAGGRIIALLGASNSGKFSLLHGVAGLKPASSGTCIRGVDASRLPPYGRGCGVVLQGGLLFPHRDMVRDAAYGVKSRRRGLPTEHLHTVRGHRRARRQKAAELLELAGLPEYEKREVTTLSGGQAQRVILAGSFTRSPAPMLLSESLSALGRGLCETPSLELWRVLTRTGALTGADSLMGVGISIGADSLTETDALTGAGSSTGTDALYVTHDHKKVRRVTGRVAVTKDGRFVSKWPRSCQNDHARTRMTDHTGGSQTAKEGMTK